jgi:hypothetical protein
MYGMTLSGKYWYQELQDWLLLDGFKQSTVVKCLFYKVFPDGSMIVALDYVDDMLYYGNNAVYLVEFETALSGRFQLELMGQPHWYLSTCITQEANYDITVDQSRYCLSLVKKYLTSVGCPNVTRFHTTPLPSDFVPSASDNSLSDEAAGVLSTEYNLDFASCVGALIYLALTRTDIIHSVNKLAKLTRKPGRAHFNALVHLLHYLCDNVYYGVRYYSDMVRSPVYKILQENKFDCRHLFYTFSDSSWQDDEDTGRSTGCFLVYYMGGIVDHSSNMPDPVALCSAEAEYNEACLACMATSPLRMLLDELELKRELELFATVPIILDSSSAIAMGNSFKDTKHTRHIMRRYHYVREGVAAQRFQLDWISTEFELADLGTKQLPGPRHSLLTALTMVKVKDSSVQEG